MKQSVFARMLGLAVCATVTCASLATAQTPEEFYSKHDLTLVVGAAAGGGADFYARQFVPFWKKHIPGQPNIIVKNFGGASGLKAAMQMSALAPKDGSQVFMLLRNNLYDPLVSQTPLDFNAEKVNWLGSLNKETYTVAVMTRAGVNSFDDLRTKTIKMGATSYSNANNVLPQLMNKYFGTKFNIITGYKGAAAMALALEQGEIDGRMLPVDNLTGYGNEAPLYKAGKIKVIVQTAVKKNPLFPDVPLLFDFTKDAKVKTLTDFILAPMEAGRPFAAPEGIPADRLAALRKSFIEAATDPDYIAAMEKVTNAPEPISGEEVQAIVKKLYSAPKDIIDLAKPLMNPPS